MTDSTLALSVFGSDKALFATDANAGVHTLKVTTDAPSDGVAVGGFGGAKYVVGTVKAAGVHTLCATTEAANSALLIDSFGAGAVRLGTVLSGGVHVVAVTTDAPNSAIGIDGFGAGLVVLATVLSNGIHTLAVTDTPDNGFALGTFGAGKGVLASAANGNAHMLAVNGLAPPYVGPLDYRPGAVGIAGTIKFYSAYAGKAIRVSNPDTNVESDIDFTSAGVLDSAQIAAAKGASTTLPVVKMYAQDGSGNDYVQATASKQPLLTQDGPGGQWSIVFDGVDDMLQTTLTLSLPYTRYAIWVPHVWYGVPFDSNQQAAVFTGSAEPQWVAGEFGLTGPVDFPTGTWSILANRFNTTNGLLRRNKMAAVTNGHPGYALTVSQLGGSWVGCNMSCLGLLFLGADDDTAAQDLVIDALGAAAGIGV